MQETSSPTESDRPLGARFMGGAGLEVFSGVSVATAPEHLHVLLMWKNPLTIRPVRDHPTPFKIVTVCTPDEMTA